MTDHGPVLVVLPPQTAAWEDRDSLLAHGLMEDVCLEMARFPAVSVISWMSGAAVAHLPDREIGERLNATHILRTRVKASADRWRITAALVDCSSDAQLWSENLEVPADNPFSLQDDLVGRIAATLAARLERSALAASRGKSPESMATYELVLRGLALLRRGTLQADEEARELFARALERDPGYARACAGLSLSYFNEWSCQFWDRFQESGRLAYQHAHRALDLDDRDAMLHVIIGRIHLYHRRFEQASWYFDRALALCPSDAENLIQLSTCHAYLGRPETGKELARGAMRLNPYHPSEYFAYAALSWLLDKQFGEALEIGAKAGSAPMVDMPAFTAVTLAHLGRMDEAREHMSAYHSAFRERITFGREPRPGEPVNWLLEINPFRRDEDISMILDGLRRLGETGATATDVHRGRAAANLPPDQAALYRQGAGWMAEFGRRRAVLPDLKGLHDIRRLLELPGDEIHCLDLAGRGADADEGDRILDDRARHELHQRIAELQDELAEAEECHDLGGAQRAREELDQLVKTLSDALDLKGRSRHVGSLPERARSTVTWRIRHAVRKIRAVHEPLGKHLANSLRTGVFCSYQPERPVSWLFHDEQ